MKCLVIIIFLIKVKCLDINIFLIKMQHRWYSSVQLSFTATKWHPLIQRIFYNLRVLCQDNFISTNYIWKYNPGSCNSINLNCFSACLFLYRFLRTNTHSALSHLSSGCPGTRDVAHAGLELTATFLLHPPYCWDWGHVPALSA